uniref:Uncharacterized protein n=1 Tax=Pyrococcus abyssi (strain GE5 / Orsay) TaxID=272844 RepID=G8ZJZ9_PYRAB|nr:TPA: hypothetical protein PAB1080.2n [Pyrococcus abyssi GE5]
MARKFKREDILDFIRELMSKVKLIENPNELAFLVSLQTGCRAIDAYFIATANDGFNSSLERQGDDQKC